MEPIESEAINIHPETFYGEIHVLLTPDLAQSLPLRVKAEPILKIRGWPGYCGITVIKSSKDVDV